MYQPKEPYGRPSELTHQAIFDKVAIHLLSQGEKAIRDDDTCDYRTPENKACAVGCLISDAEIRELGTLGAWCVVHQSFPDLDDFYGLLARLQQIHDHEPPKGWSDNLRYLAQRMGLSEEVLNETA